MKNEPAYGADLEEEVQEYARRHDCSYAEALSALAKDPGFRSRWEFLFSNNVSKGAARMNTRTWQRIRRMDDDELEEFGQAHGVDMSREFTDVSDARRYVADQLNVERPADGEDVDDNDTDDAGTELDRRARALQRKRPDLSYEQCLGRMREKYPALAAKYAESFPGGVSTRRRA